MLKVSVVIPVFNQGKYISQALDSVCRQTYKEYEIIVVDDGSIDNTAEIVHGYEKKCGVKYIYQNNKGPSSARNTGIINSQGEFIAFLDADDLWLPTKLERQIDRLEQDQNIYLVGCGIFVTDENENVIAVYEGVNYSDKDLLIQDLLIKGVKNGSTSGSLVRKICFKNVGMFDEALRGSEDRDMWVRIANQYSMEALKDPLIKIRKHKINSSKNVPIMKANQFEFISKHFSNLKEEQYRKAISHIYLDAAREYFEADRKLLSAFYAVCSIIKYNRKIYFDDDKYQILAKSIIPGIVLTMLRNIYKAKL